MNQRLKTILGLAMLGLLAAVPAAAKMVTLDPMDNPKLWDVAKDNMASASVQPTAGPEGLKALELRYELIGGNWVAYFRKTSEGTPGLKAIVFSYKGEGMNKFQIKVTDSSGTTFGAFLPSGTDVKNWTKVVIPTTELEYLYGGTGAKTVLADRILRFEFTISADAGGVGNVKVSNLEFSTEPMASTLGAMPKAPSAAAAAAPAATAGPDTKPWAAPKPIVINTAKAWQIYIDQGASASLSTVDGPQPQSKAVRTTYSWGLREVPGVQQATGSWIAMVTDVKMDLTEVKKIVFPFKNTGAVTNLEVKIHDQNGSVFGRVIPSGNAMTSWTSLAVARSEFKYLWGGDGSGKIDWGHVKQIEIALSRANDSRDTGTFDFGDITFENADAPVTRAIAAAPALLAANTTPGMSAAEAAGGLVKVPIDDFSDLNPTNRYYQIPGDDSTLVLSASRLTFQSDFSMQMRYTLQSTRPTGSWVEAQRRFNPPLDWTGVEAVKIWVRGDGSRNIFRFTIIDGEGNQWIYNNEEVLASTEWFLVSMPVDEFALFQDIYHTGTVVGNLRAHLQTVKAFSLSILSQPNRSSNAQGEIYVENLYLVGKGINVARAVPIADKPAIGIAVPLKNWNIGGTSNTLSETTPKNGNVLTQNLNFKLNGNFEKFSVLGEIRADSTFGNDPDGFRSKDATVISPNLNVTLLNPVEGISNVMIGNMWFNSDPAIFANDNLYGGWGFKGALIEGWVDHLHHRTYYLKHAPDSYSLAGHYAYNINTWNFNLLGTYYNQSPFVVSATRLEQDDKAVFLDINKIFVAPKILTSVVHLQAGYDWYQKYWDTTLQQPMDFRESGKFLLGELNFAEMTDIFWPGLSLTGKYRYVDTNYKPTYRQHPGYWDIEFGDQKGMNVKLYQMISGAFLSAEYDKLNRLSNPDQYREKTLFSIGYNNWASLDVTLTQEFATKIYHFVNSRYLYNGAPAAIDDDKNEINTTLYLAYHFSGTFILSEWTQFKRNKLRLTDERYNEMFSTTRLTYYPATNIAFSLENKFSHFGPVKSTPTINPSDPYAADDFTRIRVDLTF